MPGQDTPPKMKSPTELLEEIRLRERALDYALRHYGTSYADSKDILARAKSYFDFMVGTK